MKYKVGDRVKVKKSSYLDGRRLKIFNELPDRVATIEKVFDNSGSSYRLSGYSMKEIEWIWWENEIEFLVEPKEIFEPIENRWDILDLRKKQ